MGLLNYMRKEIVITVTQVYRVFCQLSRQRNLKQLKR